MRASGFGFRPSANRYPAQGRLAEARAPFGFAQGRLRPKPVFLLPRKQSALPQHFFAELARQTVAQQEAGIRRVADAKARHRLFIQPASGEILARPRALGALQAFLEKCGGSLLRVEQLRAQLGVPGLRRT